MSQSSNPPQGEHRERAVRGVRQASLALAICIVVTAAVVVVAVFSAPTDFRLALEVGATIAAVALSITVTTTVYYRAKAAQARQTAAIATASAADAEARIAAAHEAAADYAQESKYSESRRVAAMSAFAGAAGRMQAMSTSMLAELREMEHRHGDPQVLADLLLLDHRTAQAGRLADSIAVLSGARSGRRWAKPIVMESILRGAMGRVAGYQRVRLRAVADIAVAGHAAEGVMHALAELLDNACNFSPPTTEVHVYAAEVPAGVVVTIEDSGLVMSESALRRAELAVSGSDSRGNVSASDLSSLSGTRLGLAVVGHLARKHGLTVSYRPSAIGGTAVVVVVPRDLTARADRSPGATATLTLPAVAAPQPVSAPVSNDSQLPKRRRGSTLAAVHPDGLSTPRLGAETATPPPSRSASLGAFQRAVTGRNIDSAATPFPSDSVENDR